MQTFTRWTIQILDRVTNETRFRRTERLFFAPFCVTKYVNDARYCVGERTLPGREDYNPVRKLWILNKWYIQIITSHYWSQCHESSSFTKCFCRERVLCGLCCGLYVSTVVYVRNFVKINWFYSSSSTPQSVCSRSSLIRGLVEGKQSCWQK